MESVSKAAEEQKGVHPERAAFQALGKAANELIIGQERLMRRLVMALLCHGHLLVEGAPGLAKTRAIKVLAESIEGNFQRIQFTPDLLPADLTGTHIYNPANGVMFCFLAGAMVTVSATAVGVWFNLDMPGLNDLYPSGLDWVLAVLAVGAVIAVVAAYGYESVARFANIAACI